MLTVTVDDGEDTGTPIEVTVKVDGNGSRTTNGTASPDLLFGQNGTTNGTASPDLLFGQNGADVLNGLGSNDLLCGGRGNDTLNGAAGDDTMSGGLGADRFSGGGGTADSATDFSPSQGDTKDTTIETF